MMAGNGIYFDIGLYIYQVQFSVQAAMLDSPDGTVQNLPIRFAEFGISACP